MPDKRDMHKAKSHRNSRNNNKHQSTSPADRGAQRPPSSSAPAASAAGAPAATFTAPETAIEPSEAPMGKKNKSRH